MRIYVDLDGVIADFDRGAAELLGMSFQEFQDLHGAAVVWKRIAAAPDFYRTLPWMPEGLELWDFVCELASPAMPIILTGLPLGDWAAPQKVDWCRRELGEHVPVVTCMSIDMHRFCTKGDILIDDRVHTGIDWATAGGLFVLHTSLESTKRQLLNIITSGRAAAADPDPSTPPQGA